MGTNYEQLDRDGRDRGTKARKFIKANRSRSDRRKAKKNPMAAPRKRTYRGYDS